MLIVSCSNPRGYTTAKVFHHEQSYEYTPMYVSDPLANNTQHRALTKIGKILPVHTHTHAPSHTQIHAHAHIVAKCNFLHKPVVRIWDFGC